MKKATQVLTAKILHIDIRVTLIIGLLMVIFFQMHSLRRTRIL
jgi:hypothetical protein